MNYSNDLMIDTALNIAGFLVSGLLLMVFYSMFNKRNSKDIAAASENGAEVTEKIEEAETREPRGKVEFVNFQNRTSKVAEPISFANDSSSRFQRNRLEVIRQAREMLNSGKSTESIRNRLPIAEAELNMISQTRNNRNLRGAANDQ
jgi:hypothetical protein